MGHMIRMQYQKPGTARRWWLGAIMALIAMWFAADEMVLWFGENPLALQGLLSSLGAGAATGLGAIPILLIRRTSEKMVAPLLGLAGGMMLAACLFSLLVPAVHSVMASGSPLLLAVPTAAGLVLGAIMMQFLDRAMPHEHVENMERLEHTPSTTANLTLVVAAIALHNLPEGLAVGVAAASGVDNGMTVGIALQNIPEGWIVASALVAMGMNPWKAALLALGSGLVEPIGGFFGVVASSVAGGALPIALSTAAGAMLWVVSHELIPASHKPGCETAGTSGLMVGMSLMTLLSTLL